MKKAKEKTGKSYDFYSDIFIPLIVSVGETADELNKMYEFATPGSDSSQIGSDDLLDDMNGFTSIVRDKEDDMKYKVLVWFSGTDAMTTRNIAHEAFHASMFICYHHGMEIGMKIGQDEHAAYIAGWVANSCQLVYNELIKNKKKK